MNKKILMLAPFMGLLLTSCNKWQSISYEKAKEFIDSHYKLDGAEGKLPSAVYEKFTARAADENSCTMVVGLMMISELFYNTGTFMNVGWTGKAPFKANYANYYNPGIDLADYLILPISSEAGVGYSDVLIQSSEDDLSTVTVTYEVNGKKFKQNSTTGASGFKVTTNYTYNDKGYRTGVVGKSKYKGELDTPQGKVSIDYNFEFSATYFYAE